MNFSIHRHAVATTKLSVDDNNNNIRMKCFHGIERKGKQTEEKIERKN